MFGDAMLRPRWLVSCAAFSVLLTLAVPAVPQVSKASTPQSAARSSAAAPAGASAAGRPRFDVAPLVQPVAKPKLTAAAATVRGFDARYSRLVDEDTTPTSEFFRNADGSGTALISAVPVRFKGHDGAWHGIDPTLVTDVDGSLRPRSVEALSRIQLDQGEPAVTVSTPAGDIEVRHTGLAADLLRPLLQHVPKGVAAGTIAALAKVANTQASVAVTGGSQVRYDMGAHGFTDDIVLSSASSGSVYRVTMRLPEGAHASQSNNGVLITDSAENQLATYTGGVAYDAVAAAASPDGMSAPGGTTTPVAISLISHVVASRS